MEKFNRWQILIASTIILLCAGTVYSFSVFALPLSKAAGWTIPAIMIAFTINTAIAPIPAIIGGYFIDKGYAKQVIAIGGTLFASGFIISGFATDITTVYIAYGIITGFGMGLTYSGCLHNTIKLFPDKRGLAAGILTAGVGGAAIVVAPLANLLIEKFGVFQTFKIIGIAFIIIIWTCLLFIKIAPSDYRPEGWVPTAQQANIVNLNWKQIIRTPQFYLIAGMFGIGSFSGLIISSQASVIGQKMYALTAATAAFYVSLYALSSCLGRITWGFVSDKLGRAKTINVLFTVIILSLLTLTLGGTVLTFAIGVVGLGFCFGGIMGIFPSLIMENFGPKFQGVNYGVVFIGYSIAAFFAPRLAAIIGQNNNGNYTKAFYIAIALAIVGFLFNIAYIAVTKKKAQA